VHDASHAKGGVTLKLFDFDVSRILPESSAALLDETFAMTQGGWFLAIAKLLMSVICVA
jgi:hypothetical protein